MSKTAAEQIRQLLQERILILDGAMGTMIQKHKLEEADYRGERFADWHTDVKGNNDLLVLTQPEVIRGIHEAYLEVGADIIETNSFNATRTSQADYEMQELAYEINVEAAKLARTAADRYSTPDKPRFVAGVLGPTNRTASISPDVSDPGSRNVRFAALVDAYPGRCEAPRVTLRVAEVRRLLGYQPGELLGRDPTSGAGLHPPLYTADNPIADPDCFSDTTEQTLLRRNDGTQFEAEYFRMRM